MQAMKDLTKQVGPQDPSWLVAVWPSSLVYCLPWSDEQSFGGNVVFVCWWFFLFSSDDCAVIELYRVVVLVVKVSRPSMYG